MRRSMPVTDLREAVKPGAPQVWPEAPGNIAVDWAGLAANPDEMAAKVDAAMKSAAHVARISLVHQRINVASMEPRGGTASYDAANDSYLLRVCSQGARAMRNSMAGVMGIPPAKIRVTTEEVGGAFGLKTGPYPEYIAMLVGAKKIGRPVFWMSGRNESVRQRQPRPRRLQRRRAGARRQGQVPGAAHPPSRQHGRLHRRGRRQHPDRQHDALPARHVRHQADRRADQMRVHQHHADRALSRRRPPGGELLHRARGGRGRARHRHRSDPAAAEEPDSEEGDAVQDRGRHHLRQRRLRHRRRQGPGARRLRRLQGAQDASRRRRACCAASASASCWSTPAARRSRARRSSFPGGEQPDVHDERAVDRPEPRHDLPAHGGRTARHQARAGRPRPRRQRPRDRGLRLGRLAHRDDRGPRHGEDAGGDARQGQEGGGCRARSRRRRHRIQERRLQRGRHRPPHVAVRRRRARQGDEEEGRDRARTSTPRW